MNWLSVADNVTWKAALFFVRL